MYKFIYLLHFTISQPATYLLPTPSRPILRPYYFFEFWNLRNILSFKIYLGIPGVSFTINCYFEYRIRILCLLLYMGTYLTDTFRHFFGFSVPEVLTFFVRNIFFDNFGVLMPPHPHPPTHPHHRRQCLRSLPGESFITKKQFFKWLVMTFKKIVLKNWTKKCSVLKRAHIKKYSNTRMILNTKHRSYVYIHIYISIYTYI